MSRRESAAKTLAIVGVPRHPSRHIAKAVSAEQRVYILHSQECIDSGIDLRECEFSVALDQGIDLDEWWHWQDEALPVTICDDEGDLLPSVLRPGEEVPS